MHKEPLKKIDMEDFVDVFVLSPEEIKKLNTRKGHYFFCLVTTKRRLIAFAKTEKEVHTPPTLTHFSIFLSHSN
jgi:hypothetical protein